MGAHFLLEVHRCLQKYLWGILEHEPSNGTLNLKFLISFDGIVLSPKSSYVEVNI